MKIVNFSKTVLSVLIIGLTSCSTNNTIQSTEETIKKSGFVAPSKFETSVLFPNYMVEDYKSRNMATKGFSIKRMKQVDAVRIVIKSEQDGISQEKIVYPSSENVTATFDNVSIGRVKVYAEAWGTGAYQPSNKSNVITSGEAFVSVSENKLSEAFIALEIPKAQVDAIIEKKYGKGSVKAIVTLVEKMDIASNTITIQPPIINKSTQNTLPISTNNGSNYIYADSFVGPIQRKTPIDLIYVNGISTFSGLSKVEDIENKETYFFEFFNKKTSEEGLYLNDALLDNGELNKIKSLSSYINAKDSFLASVKEIENYISEINLSNVNIKGVYNPTSNLPVFGTVMDFYEASVQKTGDIPADLYKNLWGEKTDMQRVVDGIKLGLENSIIVDNRKVILMPHSQGNFFVEEAINQLISGKFITDDKNLTQDILKKRLSKDVLLKSVAILGLGSPTRFFSSEIPNTYYISNSKDPVTKIGTNPSDIAFGGNKNNIYMNINYYGLASFDYHSLNTGYIVQNGTKKETKDKISEVLNNIVSSLSSN